jgi:lipopolysaccharide/colanic/teichoic acid biosynthesis glycosyltransferase
VSYRRAWALVFAAGSVMTLMVATVVVLGVMLTNEPGPILFGIMGTAAAVGLALAFIQLWKVRPSTRTK